MSRELPAIDVDIMPEVARLVDEVAQSGNARLLRRHGSSMAVLLPVERPRRGERPGHAPRIRYPTIASLAGAAGTLARPMTRQEITEVIREERAAAHRAKHS